MRCGRCLPAQAPHEQDEQHEGAERGRQALQDRDPEALKEQGVDPELAESAKLIGLLTG